MGIITLALIGAGELNAGADPPFWVIASAATAIALGTYMGGWRIIKTMGSRIIKMDTAQGFAAQGSGAAVILAATHVGFPLSTTHTISGGVMGAGAAKRVSAVRWGVAGSIVTAWVLTLPASALIGGATYGVTSLFGTGLAGPLIVFVALVIVVAAGLRAPGGPGLGDHRGGELTMWAVADPVVDWGALVDVIWTSLLGGIGVTAAFAIALHGGVRAVDARRGGATALAIGYWMLTAVAFAAVMASIVFGVIVMTSKE